MAYRKPGVEITFQQRTLSPNVPTPTLLPFLFGEGYYVTEISDNKDSQFLATLTSTGLITNARNVSGYLDVGYVWFSGIVGNTYTNNAVTITLPNSVAAGTYDANSVYVDLIGTRYTASGANAGKVYHLWTEEFTFNSSTGRITISGTGVNGYDIQTNWSDSKVVVGYRMLRSDRATYIELDGIDAIQTQIGKIGVENPLALGAYNALINAGTTVYVFGVSGYTTTDYDYALAAASAKDVYAISPMTQDTTVASNTVAHVNTYSTPEAKRERIAVISRPALTSPDLTNTAIKGTVANEYAGQAYELSNRRVTYVLPPMAYVQERKHISQLRPNYVDSMMKTMNTAFPITGLKAKLIETITLSSGIKYYAGTEITQAIWSGMVKDNAYIGDYFTVRYPVPGYVMAAVVAGQIAGYPPQQGFTNLNIAGNIVEVKYSSDWFSETQLDTIAGGGNYIMYQRNPSSAIRCRHSLMTDMSSVERRELSITKVLDYVAKTLRNAFDPYIGRYNITPDFLQKLSTIVQAVKVTLQRAGIIADLVLEAVKQDDTQRDVVLVSVLVKPYYPANYIRVTLAF